MTEETSMLRTLSSNRHSSGDYYDDGRHDYANDDDDAENFDGVSTTGSSVVSVRCTNHALHRMIERDVTREKIRKAKKHGLISLQLVENNLQLAETWLDRLKMNFPGIDGRVLPWTEELGRIEVNLVHDVDLTRAIKSFLEDNCFFQANTTIRYTTNELKVIEGKRSASTPTQILTVFLVCKS